MPLPGFSRFSTTPKCASLQATARAPSSHRGEIMLGTEVERCQVAHDTTMHPEAGDAAVRIEVQANMGETVGIINIEIMMTVTLQTGARNQHLPVAAIIRCRVAVTGFEARQPVGSCQ